MTTTKPIETWLTEGEIIDTLLRHACTGVEVTWSDGTPVQTKDDLYFRIEELNHPAPGTAATSVQSELSTAMKLMERAKTWERILSGAIARADTGGQSGVLLAKNMRTPLDHPEADDWRFHIESVYEWAKDFTGIDVPEWREALTDHTVGVATAGDGKKPRPVNDLAMPALASLIRMLLLDKEATWTPGKKPSGKAQDYYRGNNLHQSALASAAIQELPPDPNGRDRVRVSTTYIKKAEGMVVAKGGEAPSLSEKELPAAYRVIYGLALAVARHHNSQYDPDSGHTWPPDFVLDRAAESGLASRDELDQLLKRARVNRLKP